MFFLKSSVIIWIVYSRLKMKLQYLESLRVTQLV